MNVEECIFQHSAFLGHDVSVLTLQPLPTQLHRRQCWKRGVIHSGMFIPRLALLHTNPGGQDEAISIRGQGTWTGIACWPCEAVSGNSSGSEAWLPLEEPVEGWGDHWVAVVAGEGVAMFEEGCSG